jgi:hypothetical protein
MPVLAIRAIVDDTPYSMPSKLTGFAQFKVTPHFIVVTKPKTVKCAYTM